MPERDYDPDDDECASDGGAREDPSEVFDCAGYEACEGLTDSLVEEVEGLGYATIMSSVRDSMHV